MKTLLKYLVFLLYCFKVSMAIAAEIDTSALPDSEPAEDTSFKAVVNLPQPAAMRQSVQDTDGVVNKLLLLGAYFNARYPEDSIETDLSDDLQQMFPNLTPKEAKSRSYAVQRSIMAYRWGADLYRKIKEQLLVPPEKPLIVSDDQYAVLEPYRYQETPEGKFAIMYDFKKIVSYSANPKDMASMRAKRQRDADAKVHKTDFDKFKSMVGKLELSKLSRYGVDLPVPFIGNAGTSPWEEKDSFRVRMISELAEYHDIPEFIAGIHVVVPTHRFILGTSLSESLQKPKIELIDSENVRDFEVFYPVPAAFISEKMIGGYAGDFLFPIRITPEKTDQDIRIHTKTLFQNCDIRLNCQPLETEQTTVIEHAKENDLSSFRNFIRQSYNNLPSEKDSDLEIESFEIETQTSEQDASEIYLTLNYRGSINNLRLFVEDDAYTQFSRPNIGIADNQIRAVFKASDSAQNLIGRNFRIMAGLNDFHKISATRGLRPKTSDRLDLNGLHTALFLLAGLFLTLTPLGFFALTCFCLLTPKKHLRSVAKKIVITIALGGFGASAVGLYFYRETGFLPYWGLQYQVIPYMLGGFFAVLFGLNLLNRPTAFQKAFALLGPYLIGGILILLTPLSFGAYLKQSLFEFIGQTIEPWQTALATAFFVLGVAAPYALFYIYPRALSFRAKLKMQIAAQLLLYLQLTGMIVILLLENSFSDALKIFGISVAVWLAFRFIFTFEKSLQETSLARRHKKNTEYVLLCIALGLTCIAAQTAPKIRLTPAEQTIPTMAEIREETAQGKTVILRFRADWCFMCRFSDWTTYYLFEKNMSPEDQNLRIVTIDANVQTPEISAYYRKFRTYAPPLNVLYNYQVSDGFVLPLISSTRDLKSILNNFTL